MSYVFSRPVAEKATYLPNETVQFMLSNPGFSILPSSIRVSGTATFEHAGVPLDNTHIVYHDNDVGFEGLFSSTTVKLNGRTIETINDYPRMRKAILAGSETEEQVGGESTGACRGSSGAMGINTRDKMIAENNPNFSFKLDVCLNKTNQPIASAKGIIELWLRLEQPLNFFWGEDADNTTTYTLSNLIIEYRIAPQAPEDLGDLTMTVMNTMKQSLETSNNQVSLSLPIPTKSVFATFISQPNSLDTTFNYLEMENPVEGVTSIEWSINDNNAYEKFPFENDMEARYNFLMALSGLNNGKNSVTLGQLQDYRKYGIGFNYYQYFNANSKFGLNVQLDTAPFDPYFIYLYFAGVATV